MARAVRRASPLLGHLRKLRPLVITGARSIGAALLAPSCPCCEREMGWGLHGVCAACWEEVLPGARIGCEICGRAAAREPEAGRGLRCARCLEAEARGEGPPFSAVVAWGHYHGRLKDLIHAFKYGGRPGLARPLGARLAEALVERGLAASLDGSVLVPVPLAGDRRRQRGYDQALLLARRLRGALRRRRCAPWGVARALRRVRDGVPQTGLARRARLTNPRGAFGPGRRATRVRGRTAVVVDDVMTTGATAAECASILLDAGARNVIVAVAARTPARGANYRSAGGSSGGDGEIDRD